MNHLLKVIFTSSVIFGFYFYIDDSLEKVQNTTIKDLTYVMMGDTRNTAYKKQQEKRLDKVLNKMEKGGFDIDQTMLDALEKNSYIKDVKWLLKENEYRGLDQITLTYNLVDDGISIPINATFFTKPKPSALTFISDPNFSELYPLISIEVSANGKTAKFTDKQAYEMLVTFYNEVACKSLLKTWKKH